MWIGGACGDGSDQAIWPDPAPGIVVLRSSRSRAKRAASGPPSVRASDSHQASSQRVSRTPTRHGCGRRGRRRASVRPVARRPSTPCGRRASRAHPARSRVLRPRRCARVRLEPLDGAYRRLLVVATAHQLVERAVEPLLRGGRGRLRRRTRRAERDGLAVCEPDALDRNDAHARAAPRPVSRRARLRGGAPGARRDAETAELVGQSRRAGELELRHGNERPAVEPLLRLSGLAARVRRAPAAASSGSRRTLGELPLGGEAVAAREQATVECPLERCLDLSMGRAVAGLDGREPKLGHNGLDFSA